MLTQRMLQTGVSFEKLDEIIHEKFLRVAEDLPSSSQWQQLREKALHSSTLSDSNRARWSALLGMTPRGGNGWI